MTFTKEESRSMMKHLKYTASHPDGRGHIIVFDDYWVLKKSGARRVMKKFYKVEDAIEYAKDKMIKGILTGIVLHRDDGGLDRIIA